MLILVLTMAFFGVFGGWGGWLLGTRALYGISYDALDPVLFNPESAPKTFARRRRTRLLMTAAGAVLGALGGILALAFLAR